MQVVLRDVVEGDLPTFYAQQCEPEACRMARFEPRDRDAFMKHWNENVLASPSNAKQTIVVAGEIAGNVGAWDLEGQRFVGYWLGGAFWGRGVATAALREFVANHERTRPLHAWVAVDNLASRRVLEKCGFVPARADDIEILMRLAAG